MVAIGVLSNSLIVCMNCKHKKPNCSASSANQNGASCMNEPFSMELSVLKQITICAARNAFIIFFSSYLINDRQHNMLTHLLRQPVFLSWVHSGFWHCPEIPVHELKAFFTQCAHVTISSRNISNTEKLILFGKSS